MNSLHDAESILKKDFKLPINVLVSARTGERRTSVFNCVGEASQLAMSDAQYLSAISNIAGTNSVAMIPLDGRMPRYVFRYLVQEVLVQVAHTPDGGSVSSAFESALKKAAAYIASHEWVFADADETPPKLNADGSLAPKKGDKKILAKEWFMKNSARILALPKEEIRRTAIAELVKEIGLTEAGASTYWANLKSGKY